MRNSNNQRLESLSFLTFYLRPLFNSPAQKASFWYFVHRFEINSLLNAHLSSLARFPQRQSQSINDPTGEPGLCKIEDFQVACTALEGSPCSACREGVYIQDIIKRLEEEITKLKAKHYVLLFTVWKRNCSSCLAFHPTISFEYAAEKRDILHTCKCIAIQNQVSFYPLI